MNNNKAILAGLLCLALGVPAGQADTWTLSQCVDYALANNIQLKQRRVAVEQAAVDTWESQGQLWPSLSFATGQNVTWRPWSDSYVSVSNGTMTSTQNDLNYNGTYGLSAQWTIWNGGRNRLNVKRNKMAERQDELDLEATGLSIEEQIVQSYVQILYQREAVTVNKQILANTEVQRDRARSMVEVGTMARADLAQMEAQVSQCRYDVANAETQLASFRLALAQLLELTGQEESFDVAVPADIDSDAKVEAPLPALADVYHTALLGRPEIASSELGIKLAEMDVDIAKRAWWPTIGASAGINTSTSSGVDRSWGNQMKTNLSNNLGVTLSIPIFDNRSAKAGVERARLQAIDSRLQLEQQQVDLYSDLATIRLNAVNAQEQYRYAKTNLAATKESYTLVAEQFDLGLKDVNDLNTARNNLLQAEQQLLQSRYTALLNRALLLFYQGKTLEI